MFTTILRKHSDVIYTNGGYDSQFEKMGVWLYTMRIKRNLSRSSLVRLLDLYIAESDNQELHHKINSEVSFVTEMRIAKIELGRLARVPMWFINMLPEVLECTMDERIALANSITPDLSSILQTVTEPEPLGYFRILSDRECSIVRLGSKGLNSRQIAEKLFLSKGCVDTHWHNIRVKLKAKTRRHAISTAIGLALI